MSTMTDPARELAEVCQMLSATVDTSGDQFLATKFNVPVWSTEFFQIIFQIHRRIDELVVLIEGLDIDPDFRAEAVGHARAIQKAFGQEGLRNAWRHATTHFISPENANPMKFISSEVRKKYSYPKLNDEEISEITGWVDDLTSWLRDRQLTEHDFIRQAIMEGLEQFRFRIERLRWLGWGYSLQSLREVIGAYMAMEKAFPDLAASPDADAVLRKTASLIKNVFVKAKLAKDTTDIGKLLLEGYGAVTLLIQGKQSIAGLITFTGVP